MKKQIISIVGILFLFSFSLMASDHPVLTRKSAPGSIPGGDGLDTVNMFNGAMRMKIPIGGPYAVSEHLSYGFTMYYSSRIWDYEQIPNDQGSHCGPWPNPNDTRFCTEAHISDMFNAGPGWRLSFGGIRYVASAEHWKYFAPDGSEHTLYPTLHEGETGSDTSPLFYTRDNTYLRLTADEDVTLAKLEFPDGTIEYFENFGPDSGTDPSADWRVTRKEDRWGNWVTYDYNTECDETSDVCSETWVVDDSQGRHHSFEFAFDDHMPNGVWKTGQVIPNLGRKHLTRATVAAAGGRTATYRFNYEYDDIPVSALDDSGTTDDLLQGVPVLSDIYLPNNDGSECFFGCRAYSMTTNDAEALPGWVNYPPNNPYPSEVPGTISSLAVPAGTVINWQYRDWNYPVDSGLPGYNHTIATVTGVASKETTYADDKDPSLWTYLPQVITADHMRNCVRGPALIEDSGSVAIENSRDDTCYFFRVGDIDGTSTTGEGWDYGLPYNPIDTDNGMMASVEVYDGHSDWPDNRPIRKTYVSYDHDVLKISSDDEPFFSQTFFDSNRRLKNSETEDWDYYVGPPPPQSSPSPQDHRYLKRTQRGNFDGLGHYRATTQDDPAGTGQTFRSVRNFNPDSGEYSVDYTSNQMTGSYVEWPTTKEWILNTSTFAWQRLKNGGRPTEVTRQDSCFDPLTGLLLRLRKRKTVWTEPTVPRSPDDVIVQYEYDGAGNLSAEKTFGGDGDGQSISTGGDLCGLSLGTPEYWVAHQAEYGVDVTAQFVDPDTGEDTEIYIKNNTIDLNSGLPLISTATSGYHTTTQYDAFGRPTLVTTSDAAKTVLTYTPAVGQAGQAGSGLIRAKVSVKVKNHLDTLSTPPVTLSEYEYDGLGRLWEERHEMPSENMTKRRTEYTPAGYVDRVSSWTTQTTPSNWTSYSDYDPFGRPGTIKKPDGEEVTLDYVGEISVATTVDVGTRIGATTAVTKTEKYDHLGRLYEVVEPSGFGGADHSWLYKYDVGGHLVEVSDSWGSQVRSFTYDGLGLLRSESEPERGGPISYTYDTRGNVLSRQESDSRGGRVMDFSYDPAGRVVDATSYGQVLDHYDYYPVVNNNSRIGGGIVPGGNWNSGQLQKSTRYNSDSLWDRPDISKTYEYGETGGAVSAITTQIGEGVFSWTFVQKYLWDDLGSLKRVIYPRPSGELGRKVKNNYTHGWLTAVYEPNGTNFLPNISYHANGMFSQINHGNGVSDSQSIAYGMMRPTKLETVVNTGTGFSTGQITYDGAGNITGMGSSKFAYDGVSRLVRSEQQFSEGAWRNTTFSYDPYGNLTGRSWTDQDNTEDHPESFPVDPATNHLQGETYNYHGAQQTQYAGSAGTQYIAWDYLFEEVASVSGGGLNETYTYDADGERVMGQPLVGVLRTRYFLRDLDGKVLSEFELSGGQMVWKKDYIYRGSQMAAVEDADDGLMYFHLDQLGTPRLITDASGATVATHDYAPFGFEVSNALADGVTKKFTGHERDSGNNPGTKYDLDYMHARYYSAWQSRFLSVDPLFGDIHRPQTLNRYSYVSGNPMNLVDPFGLQEMDLQLSYSCSDQPGGCSTWYEGDYFFNPRLVQEMWWSAMINRGRQEFGNIDIPVFQGNSSLAVQGRFYASMLADKATGQGEFYGEGPDELLAYEFFGPQGVGALAGLESRGSFDFVYMMGAGAALRGSVGEFFGRSFPTKVGYLGRQQPFNPANGRYLPFSANRGFWTSPAGAEFAPAFGAGVGDSKGMPSYTPATTPGRIGYFLGRIIGHFIPG